MNEACYEAIAGWATGNLKSNSHLSKKIVDLLDWEPFKNDGECFFISS